MGQKGPPKERFIYNGLTFLFVVVAMTGLFVMVNSKAAQSSDIPKVQANTEKLATLTVDLDPNPHDLPLHDTELNCNDCHADKNTVSDIRCSQCHTFDWMNSLVEKN